MGFDIVNFSNRFLRTKAETKESAMVVDEELDVSGFNSALFHVFASSGFNAKIYIEGGVKWSGIYKWFPITLFDKNNNQMEYNHIADNHHFYRVLTANISAFNVIRLRQEVESGTTVQVGYQLTSNRVINNPFKNRILYSKEDTYINGVSYVFFGDKGRTTTDNTSLLPLNVSSYRKKTIFIENNRDTDLTLMEIQMHKDANEFADKVLNSINFETVIPAGENLTISSNIYPELEHVFNGLSLKLFNSDTDATGNIKVTLIGGN